jgi:hypothetical protein
MALLRFRTRSPERDAATDARRLDRLSRLLSELADEIAAEKSGLENRYRSATTDAAFLVEAVENDSATDLPNGRVDALTDVIVSCERRLDVLAHQAALINEVGRALTERGWKELTSKWPRR